MERTQRRVLPVLLICGLVAVVALDSGVGLVCCSSRHAVGGEPAADLRRAAAATGDRTESAKPTQPDSREPAPAPPRFALPDGFVIEQVAGPPLVRYPLFACFDDAGRLYVAEGTGKSVPGEELVKLKLGRITRLDDTNGDGQFDTSALVADQLVFPQGVLWHDGVLYVASHPAIWKLEDHDGDGRAEKQHELVGKFNFNGNGCDIHGPFLGPDGRLYWTDGRHGYRIETAGGVCLEGLASRIWRCRTNGSDLERLAGGGFDNPVELAWTTEGELLGTMDQGAGDCLLHYVEGGVYPMEHPCISELTWTGPPLDAVKRYPVELPAALCGTLRYRSAVFGDEFSDSLITTHYMTHKLVRSRLTREGSTFRAEDTDFLVSSDPHLRLTDVVEDADGSLLVVDMGSWFTYGFLGDPLPRPDRLGAIYRIRRRDAPPVADSRGRSLELARRKPAELVSLLDDPRPAVRDQVIHRLASAGIAAVGPLQDVLRATNRTVEARRNAIWALCRIDAAEARAAIRPALADGDASVRLVAVHAAGLHRDAAALDALCALARSGDLAMCRKAAEALGRIGKPEAVPVLLDALRRDGDRFLEHSLIYALIQIAAREPTLAAIEDSHPRVRRAALVALDQMRDGKLEARQLLPLLASSDPMLEQTALEVIARRPAWAGAAHAVLRKWLASPQLEDQRREALAGFLLAACGEPGIQELVAESLTSPATPAETRIVLIDVIRQSRLEQLPAGWAQGLRRALTHEDTAVRSEALAAVQIRGWREFDEQLGALGRQTDLPDALRMAALECLAAARQPLPDDLFEFLAGHLSEQSEPLPRLTAARTLARNVLTNQQLLRLAERSGRVSTLVLRLLLPVFGASDNMAVKAALVTALRTSPAAEALTVAELDQVLESCTPATRQDAQALREKLLSRQKDQAAYLARLSAELEQLKGDGDAGKEVFLSPKNNCYGCHRAVGRGGTVGPELSKIGQLRTRAELLESIIFPSLTIAPQYRSHALATRDGRALTGLIVRETPEALYLRTTELAELRITRSSVEELTPSVVSLMPDGLEKTLSRQELANLLEFLCQQR